MSVPKRYCWIGYFKAEDEIEYVEFSDFKCEAPEIEGCDQDLCPVLGYIHPNGKFSFNYLRKNSEPYLCKGQMNQQKNELVGQYYLVSNVSCPVDSFRIERKQVDRNNQIIACEDSE